MGIVPLLIGGTGVLAPLYVLDSWRDSLDLVYEVSAFSEDTVLDEPEFVVLSADPPKLVTRKNVSGL